VRRPDACLLDGHARQATARGAKGIDPLMARLQARYPDRTEKELRAIVAAATSLAEEISRAEGMPEFRYLFNLARRIKAAVRPRQRGEDFAAFFAPAALVFRDELDRLGALPDKLARIDWHDDEQVLLTFEDAWVRAKFAEGEDILAEAALLAGEQPVRVRGEPEGSKLTRLVGIAYHLQQKQEGAPILLPVRRIATVLGVSPDYASMLIRKVVRLGLIKDLEPGTRPQPGKAKRYVFNSHSDSCEWKATRAPRSERKDLT
jgi:hypothetical protein